MKDQVHIRNAEAAQLVRTSNNFGDPAVLTSMVKRTDVAVTVLRAGRVVASTTPSETCAAALADLMVGGHIDTVAARTARPPSGAWTSGAADRPDNDRGHA